MKFLSPRLNASERRFNLLPKVKQVNSRKWPSPVMPPGRPIVADVRTNTSNVARLIEHFLFPLVSRLPSFLIDSQHLIAILRRHDLHPDSVLCTMDVSSLYTNVPINAGIQRVSRAFDQHPDPQRPDGEILRLLHLCLTRNDFLCNSERWLQVSGVAMGKAFGGSFANLYLGEWESSALASSPLQPDVWVRYQDDIFLIWRHGLVSLMAFHQHLNAQDPNIQLSLTHSRESVHFLDHLVYRSTSSSHRLSHRVAFKPTACHRLLPKESNHAAHVHKGLIHSHLLRWSVNSSTRQDFDDTYHEVTKVWRSSGVSRSLIRENKQRIFSLTGLADSWTHGFARCNSARCSACPFATDTTVFKSSTNNRLFPVRFQLTCASTHTVYLIECRRCGVRYVGQTCNPVQQRISQHLRAIRSRDLSSPLVPHFTDFHALSDFRFFAFDRCFSDNSRLTKESRWIRLLRTLTPLGLNRSATAPSNTVNLVTLPSACADRLNAVVRSQCRQVTDLRVRLSYTTDRNLRNSLR